MLNFQKIALAEDIICLMSQNLNRSSANKSNVCHFIISLLLLYFRKPLVHLYHLWSLELVDYRLVS